MDLPSPATSSGIFRYGMAFLLLVLAVILLYAIGVMVNLFPPPTWFPEPGHEGAVPTAGAALFAATR